jgi:hypothetical protein
MHAWALCFRNNAPALYSKSKRTVCKGAAISLATPLVSLIHFLPSLRLLRNAETGSSANRPDNSIHRGLESRFLAQTVIEERRQTLGRGLRHYLRCGVRFHLGLQARPEHFPTTSTLAEGHGLRPRDLIWRRVSVSAHIAQQKEI